MPTKVHNAVECQARAALARDDLRDALAAVARLLAGLGAGDGMPSAAARPGPEEHRLRLTLYQVWQRAGDTRADAALAEAHRGLMAQAETITDAALRRSFLEQIPENREIAWLVERPGASAPAGGRIRQPGMPTLQACSSRTGRTSTLPCFAGGMRAASWIASFRSRASTR